VICMKVNGIKHRYQTNSPVDMNIIIENLDTISSARMVLTHDVLSNDEVKNYRLDNPNEKWRLNKYGVPAIFPKKHHNYPNVTLDNFNISSDIINLDDEDSVEWVGIQLAELENVYFSKLLCYATKTMGIFSQSKFDQIIPTVEKSIDTMVQKGFHPQYIVCDNYSLVKVFSKHPSFRAVSHDLMPYVADLALNDQIYKLITNNQLGNDVISNFCLCTDMIGPLQLRDGIKCWRVDNQAIFTETIGMGIFNEHGIKRCVINKG